MPQRACRRLAPQGAKASAADTSPPPLPAAPAPPRAPSASPVPTSPTQTPPWPAAPPAPPTPSAPAGSVRARRGSPSAGACSRRARGCAWTPRTTPKTAGERQCRCRVSLLAAGGDLSLACSSAPCRCAALRSTAVFASPPRRHTAPHPRPHRPLPCCTGAAARGRPPAPPARMASLSAMTLTVS